MTNRKHERRLRKPLALATIAAIVAAAVAPSSALAADKKAPPAKQPEPAPSQAAPADPSIGEKVNVEAIKEKYWARGEETEIGVVQNRLYSKARKVQIGLFAGVNSADPFLSIYNLGVNAGYNFNEYVGAHLVVMKMWSNASSALKTFREKIPGGGNANTNPLISYYGGEATGSLLYGKLSVIGKAIIYYDMHLLGGLGITHTENGDYFTPSVGIGQQVYLKKFLSLRIDYRLMRFDEHVIDKIVPQGAANYRKDYGTRTVMNNTITLGVNFFIGGDSQ